MFSQTDKQTEGPWKTDGRKIEGPNGEYIATMFARYNGIKPDALLIAAAPDLLAALRDLYLSVRKYAPQIDQSRAVAAILKAENSI